MSGRDRYRQAMEWLYVACIALSGTALVVITLIIPLGVFMRYVMNAPLSWPEPAWVVMMVMFSFLGGAAVYRANVHVAVEALVNAVPPRVRRIMRIGIDACMAATALPAQIITKLSGCKIKLGIGPLWPAASPILQF